MKMENSTSNGIPPSTYQTARKEKAGGGGEHLAQGAGGRKLGGGGETNTLPQGAGGRGWGAGMEPEGEWGGGRPLTLHLQAATPATPLLRGEGAAPLAAGAELPLPRWPQRPSRRADTDTPRSQKAQRLPSRPLAAPPSSWRIPRAPRLLRTGLRTRLLGLCGAALVCCLSMSFHTYGG